MNQKTGYNVEQRKIAIQITRNNSKLKKIRKRYLELDIKNTALQQKLYSMLSKTQLATLKTKHLNISIGT